METRAFDLNGYTDLPPGKIANVVTYLEIRADERPDAAPMPDTIRFVDPRPRSVDWFRALTLRIGRNWLWTGVALMTDDEVEQILQSRETDIVVAEQDGEEMGLAELKASPSGDTEIVLFGVVSEGIGKGIAAPLMQAALDAAFGAGAKRVWLHTCTNDHPGAVRFYRKCGFRPYKFAVEIMDDPRLTGIYPEDAAPHVALIKPKK